MTEGMGEALPSYLVEGALNYLSDMTGFSELHADMIERGHVRNTMIVPAGATNIHGNAHGGFILGLLDSTCGMAAHTMGYANVTVQMSTNFMKPVRIGEEIVLEARVLHGGRRSTVVSCQVSDVQGRVLVSAQATMFNLEKLDENSVIPKPFYPRNDTCFDIRTRV